MNAATNSARNRRRARSPAARPVTFVSRDTFSQNEFAAWVERQADGHRYELIREHIVREPPARWEHGECSARLVEIVGGFVRRRRLGRTFDSSVGIELPSGDTIEPDLAVVSARRWRESPQKAGTFLRLVPDLVVEVLSPSTAQRDRTEKREIYEQNGVREYWLADTDSRTITRLVLEDGRFDDGIVVAAGQTLRSVVLPGFRAAVAGFSPAR
jgi:Uma2 family endonuclease